MAPKRPETMMSPLGQPLPLDDHATSVSMPLWSHVCGYEEGKQEIHEALALGYPRFVYHPFIADISALIREKEQVPEHLHILPYPSKAVAERFLEFMQGAIPRDHPSLKCNADDLRLLELGAQNVWCGTFPAAAACTAKRFWQHAGEGLSSRQAECALQELCCEHRRSSVTCRFSEKKERCCASPACPPPSSQACDDVQKQLRQRIAGLAGESQENVFLAGSGMAAIFTALRAIRHTTSSGAKAVVFGFPYLDTLKMCNRPEWCDGCHFLGQGDDADFVRLEEILKTDNVMAVFTECPSNPLCRAPDLVRLAALAKEHNFCLVVDDTIANFCNVDLIGTGIADVVVSSLTKLFSGKGDAIGGSLVLNSGKPSYKRLRQFLDETYESTLYYCDALALLENSRDFEERSAAINQTSAAFVEWLSAQQGIKYIHYPSTSTKKHYDAIKRNSPTAGYGGLMSIIIDEDAGFCPKRFYDSLAVEKGPSLGTNFTLASPYTLLAHYTELEWAESFGVKRDLIRLAVGLEPLEEIKAKFAASLQAAKKPCHPSHQEKTSSLVRASQLVLGLSSVVAACFILTKKSLSQ